MCFIWCTCSYELVKRIDSQLSGMGHDLKEVIEQMNAEGTPEEDTEVSTLNHTHFY